jgi:demethylmenaquinone methyltransferase/2-methoxy-6-polyprenyl-1,4-benzoquinol methylase
MTNTISSVTRSKEQARRYYNRLSGWYDLIAGSEAPYRQRGLALLSAQPGERILEIGFGTGESLVALAESVGTEGFVYGIELSDGMIAQAQQRLAKSGLEGRTSLLLADGAQVPFSAGSLDAIFMSFTMELFDTPEIPVVLQQCRRLLHPRGRLGVVSLVKTDYPGLAERIYEWFHRRMPVAVDCRPIRAQESLRRAGFAIEQVVHESMWGLPVESILARNTSP